MARELIKGNNAVVKAAIIAGCDSYFGYPITPASEIAESASYYFPMAGRTFLQAESEVASINMLYGASAAGERTMTGSSSPGVSLMMEGISYCAAAELPCVLIYIMRGGPGLGNIAPEQADYNQIVKGGGHGNYNVITLAPNSVQEMVDLTIKIFELTDKYRNPGVILTDGIIGQMMEPVVFPEKIAESPRKDWALYGDAASKKNLITSIFMDPDELEARVEMLYEKYAIIEQNEVNYEEYKTEDADVVLVGYGIVSRILYSVVDICREQGLKIGMFRPISLWPFPKERLSHIADHIKKFLVVEMSKGMLVDDVKLATEFKVPIEFFYRIGGNIPSQEEILDKVMQMM